MYTDPHHCLVAENLHGTSLPMDAIAQVTVRTKNTLNHLKHCHTHAVLVSHGQTAFLIFVIG